jgi:transcriptional regulator with XRE-family HTH domain
VCRGQATDCRPRYSLYEAGMSTSIAERIALERMALAMTQEELAKLVGTHQPVVSYWESGRQEPSLTSAARLAKTFDVTLDYLVFGAK